MPSPPPVSLPSPPPSPTPPDFRVHAVLGVIQLIFAGFHVVARAVLGQLDPLALVGLRVLLATPLLVLWALSVDRRLPSPRDLPHLALLGFLGVFANQVLFLTGLARTTATNASILMSLIPVFAAGVGALFGVERVGGRRFAGILIAVAGAVVLLDPASFSLSEGTTVGNLLVLTNCFCYACFLVAQRPLLRRLPWRTVIAGAFVFGTLGVVPLAAPRLAALDFAAQPAGVWWGLAYIVIFPTFLAYAFNSWALGRSSPSLVAIYTTVQPLFACLLATFFLGESLGPIQALGFLLTTAGLWLTSWRRRADLAAAPGRRPRPDSRPGGG